DDLPAPAFGVDTPAPESADLSRYEAAMDEARPEAPHAVQAHGHSHDAHGHDDHGHDSHFGHESPPIMTVPLIVLAVGAALVGLIFGPLTHWFAHHVEETPTFDILGHAAHGFDWATAITG